MVQGEFLFLQGGFVRLALRKSFSAKVTAVGFIFFILFGNFYLVPQLTGTAPAAWIPMGFTLSLLLIALGGIGMGLQTLWLPRIKLSEAEIRDNDRNSSL